MSTRIAIVAFILIAVISINGVLSYIALSDASNSGSGVSIVLPEKNVSAKNNVSTAGDPDGEGGAPFSLYPLRPKDLDYMLAVYKPDSFPEASAKLLENQFSNLAYELLGRLSACYGSLYYYIENQSSIPEGTTKNNEYYSSVSQTLLSEYLNYKAVKNIIYAAYIDNGEDYEGWLWKPFFENKDYNTWWEFNGTNTMAFIENAEGATDEQYRLYTRVMECNLYEVMLGERITPYPAELSSLNSRIASLRARYLSRAEYTGFSEMDAENISEYLLRYVIGVTNKNGLALFRLIKRLVDKETLEAVSERRAAQLAGKGFAAKGIIEFVKYAADAVVPYRLKDGNRAFTLKGIMLSGTLTREFNALPLDILYNYDVHVADNGVLNHAFTHQKLFYNKWFTISSSYKISPLKLDPQKGFSAGIYTPENGCIYLVPRGGAVMLFGTQA